MNWLRSLSFLTPVRSLTPWDWLCLGCSSLIFSPLLGAICSLGAAARMCWLHRPWFLTDSSRPFSERLSLWILGLLTISLGVSTAWADHPGAAALGLCHFIPYFFVFVGLTLLLTSPQRLQTLAWILVWTALPVSLIGIGQLYWGWAGPISLGPWINWELTPGGNPPQRMSSVFAYANVLADYWVIIWALAIGLAAEQIQQIQQIQKLRGSQAAPRGLPQTIRPTQPALGEEKSRFSLNGLFPPRQLKLLKLVLLGLILLATATGLILADSRNAWAIALLVGLLYSLYWVWWWILAGFSSIVVLATGAAFAPPPAQAPLRLLVPRFIWARLNDQLYPDRPTEQLRSTQWQFAWDMAIQKPWTGWGLRSFPELYENKSGLRLGHPHNFYLMTAAETGFVTAVLLLVFVGWILGRSLQGMAKLPYRSFAQQMQVMFFMAFLSTCLFHLLDVPLFDLRINLLGWILLAGLASGASNNSSSIGNR